MTPVLTPRERILAALQGEPTDRVPYQEVFFGHRAFAEHFGGPQDSPAAAARYLRHSGQCSYLVGGFWWCPGGDTKVLEDGTRRYAGGHPWTMAEVEAMQEPDLAAAAASMAPAIAAARAQDLACHVFIMSSFHSASTAMGLENLCYTLCDAPEVLHAYLDRIEGYNRKALRFLAGADIDFVFIDGDCAYKNGLMVSPTAFREFWCGRTRETVAVCRENGWPYCYHTDGKIDEVYPLLIELGFSAAHGVEAAANDLVDIKRRFGRDLTLIGNFDIVELASRTPAQVAELTRHMLDAGTPGGRYIAACNTLPGDNIPLANMLAYRDAIVEYAAPGTAPARKDVA